MARAITPSKDTLNKKDTLNNKDTLNKKDTLNNKDTLNSRASLNNRATMDSKTRCTTLRSSRVILLRATTKATAEVPAPAASALVLWLRSHAAAAWISSSENASGVVRTGHSCLHRGAMMHLGP